jgi:5-methylcytosine-specific restriction enzyme subunit McrC
MLALLFDMNSLWEEYILVQLKKACVNKPYSVEGQQSKTFWGNMSLRPDIIITQNDETQIVIDTKWKRIEGNNPSTHDLRQMYVYNDHWTSKFSILLYPGSQQTNIYFKKFEYPQHSCGVLKMNVLDAEGKLDQRIGEALLARFESTRFLIM